MSMMHNAIKNVRNIPKHKGDIGLEIETETLENDAYQIPTFALWDIHRDDSLRDFGVEYVFKTPYVFDTEVKAALSEFKEKTSKFKFKKNSWTTSVHVHLNMLNESYISFGNFFTIYSLVENLLSAFAGENRRSNGFCLPICDAETTYHNMKSMLQSLERKDYYGLTVNRDENKYAALNLSSLTTLGSVECRLFRGETDTDKIFEWISILHSILKYSRTEGLTPASFIDKWKNTGMEMLNDIFGQHRAALKHPQEEELIDKNFWYAINIAYCIKDWSKMVEEKPKNLSSKDLDHLAMKFWSKAFIDLSEAQKKKLLVMAKDDRDLGEVATAPVVRPPEPLLRRRAEFNPMEAIQRAAPAGFVEEEIRPDLEDDF